MIMKKLILSLVLVFALASAQAERLPILKVDYEKSVVLDVNDWNTNELTITFSGKDGETFFVDAVNPKEKSAKKYNLNLLPRGEYTMEIADSDKSIIYDIKVDRENFLSVSKRKPFYAPVINVSGDVVEVSLLARSQNVFIGLYDEAGNELFVEKIKEVPAITKRLDISKLDPGTYTLSVEIGGKAVVKTFEK